MEICRRCMCAAVDRKRRDVAESKKMARDDGRGEGLNVARKKALSRVDVTYK